MNTPSILIITGAQGVGKSLLAQFIESWCPTAEIIVDNEPVDPSALPKDRPVVIVTNDVRLLPMSFSGLRRVLHVHLSSPPDGASKAGEP